MMRIERGACSPDQAERALAALDHGEGLYFGVDAGIAGLHPLQATLVTRPALRLGVREEGLEVWALTPFGQALLESPLLRKWRDGPAHSPVEQLRGFLRCFEPSADVLLLGALRFEAHRLNSVIPAAASPVIPAASPVNPAASPVNLAASPVNLAASPVNLAAFPVNPAAFPVNPAAFPVIPAKAGIQRGAPATPKAGALDSRLRGNDGESRLRGHDGELGVFYFPERMLRRDARGQWTWVQFSLPGIEPGTEPLPAASDHETPPIGDDHAPGGYAAMVARALTVLRERPLVSLTLSQSYRRRVDMPPSQAFARLRAANPAPASFFLNDGSGLRLFGASPDLQLVVSGGEVQALPVCGTVARRPGAQGEADSLRELFNEDVDAAALAVCSDALREDLAPLCEPGSLRLRDRRRPMSLATVVHAVDRVAGRLRADRDAWDAIVATAAPVMLTGAPRAEALRAIAELEASPRGWYGGMVAQVAANGDALVGTLLRAAAVRGGIAEVRTGGDLLADSSPEREEAESRLKTRSLWRAFGLEAAPETARVASRDEARLRVRLLAEGDPFQAALADTLAALGIECAQDAPVCVIAGTAAAPEGLPSIAIGDAAYRLLAQDGDVEAVPAEHGRVLHGTRADTGERFTAGRYATHRLVRAPADWQVLATEDGGGPVALAEERATCLLYRPDSLLCDDTARQLLREAVARLSAT